MLPTLLSNNLCSLKSNVNRLAFVMDVIIHADMPSLEKHAAEVKPGNFYESILSSLGYTNNQMPVADMLRRVHGLQAQGQFVGRFFVAPSQRQPQAHALVQLAQELWVQIPPGFEINK
jgi:hypothetical protein